MEETVAPRIQIDDDVFSVLKSNAEPFVDTPNSVLRRLLGMAASANGSAPEVFAETGPRESSRRQRAPAPS